MLDYENIPYVIREEGIKQSPIRKISKDGTLHFKQVNERYGNFPDSGSCLPVIFIDTREIPITFHKHDYLEIVCVLEGKLLSKSRTDVVNLQKGDIWITNINSEHALACSDGQATIVNICVPIEIFEEGILKEFYEETGTLTDFIKGKSASKEYLYFVYSENHIYKRIIDYILLEANSKRETHSHLQALLLLLVAELSAEQKTRTDASNNKMVEILTFMEKNYATISMKDIAEHFNYTENYLTKFIKKSTGQNASQLLIELRLTKACELLADTDYPVEEIAYNIGYKSSGYFYNLFKKTYHITPVQYREMNSIY